LRLSDEQISLQEKGALKQADAPDPELTF